MKETIRTITLHAQQIEKDKQKFIACSAEIGGKWYKIKFTQACESIPKEKGLYVLTFDFDDCSVELGKKYTTSKGKQGVANDTIWVRKVVELRAYTEEELRFANREAFKCIFGD